MLSIICLLLALSVWSACVCRAQGTAHFMPWGPAAGDTRLDGSQIMGDKTFQFLGKPCGSLAVLVSGQMACSNFVADDFERYGVLYVFSGRSYYSRGGDLYYREVSDDEAGTPTLQLITDAVTSASPEFSAFVAEWAIVVTYSQMVRSAAPAAESNTFQAVVASGPGGATFAIYSYGDMQWGTGAGYIKTGFYKSESTYPLTAPAERYTFYKDTAYLASGTNSGVTGRYVYRIDAAPVIDPADDCRDVNCNSGTCVDGEDTYVCECSGVYGGAFCDELRDFDCEANNPCWPALQTPGQYFYKHALSDCFVFCAPQAECQVVDSFYWASNLNLS